MRLLSAFSLLCLPLLAQAPEMAVSKRVKGDPAVSVDPQDKLWQGAPALFSETSAKGQPTPGHRTEIRSRWSATSLYFLFICPYEELYLLPEPATNRETNKLWERDVAEIFIGADFDHIWQYREFQVSPQGEWVDLDIDRKSPKPEGGWGWNSGFQVAARIDARRKVWYGAMKIPIRSITEKTVGPDSVFRANFFRLQGPPPMRASIAWRATGATGNHHVPEAFGLLRLEK